MPIDARRIAAIKALQEAIRESEADRKASDLLASKPKFIHDKRALILRRKELAEQNWDYIARLARAGNPQAKALYNVWLKSCDCPEI